METNKQGFTLIEVMIVISIIGILATMALPSYQDRVIRAQVQEALDLSQFVQDNIAEYYRVRHRFPIDNKDAGLPVPEKIIGNFVQSVAVDKGVITVKLGNRINLNAADKLISIRPAIVADEPIVPIAWVYGYASVPGGMTVIGDNRTTIHARHLPVHCRY